MVAMATIHKFRVELAGFPGAPGVNTFYALAPSQGVGTGATVDDFSQQLKSFYTTLRSYLPAGMSMNGPSSADVLNVETGDLETRIPVATPWNETGGDASSATSRATMAKLRFLTDRVHRGRFLQGGIFFGPLTDGAISGAGAILPTFDNAVNTATQGLLDIVGDLRLAVWSSPKEATANRPGSVGTYGYVQQVGVMPVPAVLRSRRG